MNKKLMALSLMVGMTFSQVPLQATLIERISLPVVDLTLFKQYPFYTLVALGTVLGFSSYLFSKVKQANKVRRDNNVKRYIQAIKSEMIGEEKSDVFAGFFEGSNEKIFFSIYYSRCEILLKKEESAQSTLTVSIGKNTKQFILEPYSFDSDKKYSNKINNGNEEAKTENRAQRDLLRSEYKKNIIGIIKEYLKEIL